MFEYMERFGFNRDPRDRPARRRQVSTSGVYDSARACSPPRTTRSTSAAIAIGQERLLVTPLQMAEVAAAVANDGDADAPAALGPGRRPRWAGVDKRMDPKVQSEVMSPEAAETINDDDAGGRQRGNRHGGGALGDRRRGQDRHGRGPGPGGAAAARRNQAWFIGFAPADDPQIAVAATIECTSGLGGEVAAPIAGVMEACWQERGLGGWLRSARERSSTAATGS